MHRVPTFDVFFNPLIEALKQLGGSGTNEEIDTRVAEIMNLSDELLELPHNPDKGSQTEVQYRLAWARTYLKKYGLLENSGRGVWALTARGRNTQTVDSKTVKKHVRDADRQQDVNDSPALDDDNNEIEALTWQQTALEALFNIEPAAFERLAQRLLRESGFIQVEVLGKSGDGGIDGKGLMRLGGLLSFHVYFQCKRYRGSVSSNQIRDFRGAMAGRADKGLLITTGNFTKDAIKEATRDGAQPIDLIDGELLVVRLKELGLGIKTEKVVIENERVIVQPDWFRSI
jgi:restriction system protein